jgi:outer membrane protein, heavy metal efflux system
MRLTPTTTPRRDAVHANVRSRRIALVCLLLSACLAGGCIWSRGGHDRAWIADDLHERTGYLAGPSGCPTDPFIPPGVVWEDGISEDEAIALALCNNTAYQELLSHMGLARADLLQARLIPNPHLAFLVPNGPHELEATLELPFDLLLLRGKRIAAAQDEAGRIAEQLVQGGLDLIRDVRLAFADVLLARDRVQLADDAAKLRDRIAALAEKRVGAGEASRLEADAARIDSLRGRQEAARVVYDVTLAEQRLRTLMGLGFISTPLQMTEPEGLPGMPVAVNTLVDEAVVWRPDVRTHQWEAQAARQQVRLARLGQFGLQAGGDIKALGGHSFEVGPSFSATLPIFNQNQGKIALARAQLEQATRAWATARDRAALQVRQAHTQYVQARADLLRWEKEIRPAIKDAVARAEKAYRVGNTSLLLTLDTTRQLIEAQVREAVLRADVRRAWAELERSVGRRLTRENDLCRIDPSEPGTPVPIPIAPRTTR